jgi:hypothetical protein
MSEPLTIEFHADSAAEAGRLAASLRNALLDAAPEAEIELARGDAEAMDMGTLLTLVPAVLGSGAAVALAKGLQAWLTRHHGVSIEIKTKDGVVKGKNLTGASALEAIRLALGK